MRSGCFWIQGAGSVSPRARGGPRLSGSHLQGCHLSVDDALSGGDSGPELAWAPEMAWRVQRAGPSLSRAAVTGSSPELSVAHPLHVSSLPPCCHPLLPFIPQFLLPVLGTAGGGWGGVSADPTARPLCSFSFPVIPSQAWPSQLYEHEWGHFKPFHRRIYIFWVTDFSRQPCPAACSVSPLKSELFCSGSAEAGPVGVCGRAHFSAGSPRGSLVCCWG